MDDKPFTVGIVVDPSFGERLANLAAEMPVWIADTPGNRVAVERQWRVTPRPWHLGVTTFKVNADGASELWCADILSDVDLHHGLDSQDPPYSVVEVFGTLLTEKLATEFNSLGFATFEERHDGFRARRRTS